MGIFSVISFLAAVYPILLIVMTVLVIIWVQKYLALKKEQNDILRDIVRKMDLNK